LPEKIFGNRFDLLYFLGVFKHQKVKTLNLASADVLRPVTGTFYNSLVF